MVGNKIIRDSCQGLKDGQGIELKFRLVMRFDSVETEESFPEHNVSVAPLRAELTFLYQINHRDVRLYICLFLVLVLRLHVSLHTGRGHQMPL